MVPVVAAVDPVVVATVVVVGLFVVALAAYLLVVVAQLVRTRRAVALLLDGIRRIAEHSKGLGSLLRDVNDGLRDLEEKLSGEPPRPEPQEPAGRGARTARTGGEGP